MPRILSKYVVMAIAGTCTLYRRAGYSKAYAVYQEGPHGPTQLSDWTDSREQGMHELRRFFRVRTPAQRMVEYREPRREDVPSLTELVDFYVGVPEDNDGYPDDYYDDNHDPW